MASAHEIWEGRQGTGSFPFKRTYTRVFDVYTDSAADGNNTAANLPGISQGDPHPEDPGAFCNSIAPAQKSDSPTQWTVTFGYDSNIEAPDALQPGETGGETPPTSPAELAAAQENPLTRPIRWKVSFQQTQEVARKDRNADPIRNSAKLPFDPPIVVEVSRPIVTAVVNTATFELADAQYMQDAVNSDTWFGMEPRTLRCVGTEAESQIENGFAFWQRTYTFAIKWDTWDFKILDCGYAELDPGSEGLGIDPHWVKIVDEHGAEPTEPVPLNGSGRKLTPGDDEVYLTFRVYREVSYAENVG
ncbi:MAG: hypothetical protein V4515_00090 [Chloroflexota bacterium]